MINQKPPRSRSVTAMSGAFWSALDLIIPTAFGFGVFVITSRILSPTEFGVVALATGVTLIGSALCPAGFGTALVQRREIGPEHLDSVFWLCLVYGIAMALLIALLARPIAVFLKMDLLETIIPVLALRIVAEMAGVVPNALLARGMSFHIFAARTFVVSLLAALITLGLLLLHFGVWALVASQLTVTIAGTLAGFWSVQWRPRWFFSRAVIRELSGYGAFASASRGLGQIVAQNELLFVGYALGTAEVGFYNFAKRVFSIFNDVIGGALATVAHPMLSGIQDDLVRVKKGFLSATFVSSMVAFPMLIGLAIISDHLVPLLFGTRWLAAIGLLKLQCLLGILGCIGVLQAALITSRGDAAWWFYYQLFSTATTMLIIVFVARYGAQAMLAAIVVKAYLIWALPVHRTLKILAMPAKDYFLHFRAPTLGSFILGVTIYAGRHWTHGLSDLPESLFEVGIGSASYLTTLFLMEGQKIMSLTRLMFPKLLPAGPKAGHAD